LPARLVAGVPRAAGRLPPLYESYQDPAISQVFKGI